MTSNLWSLCRTRPMCSSVSELPMPTSSTFCTLTGYVIFKAKIIKIMYPQIKTLDGNFNFFNIFALKMT